MAETGDASHSRNAGIAALSLGAGSYIAYAGGRMRRKESATCRRRKRFGANRANVAAAVLSGS